MVPEVLGNHHKDRDLVHSGSAPLKHTTGLWLAGNEGMQKGNGDYYNGL